MEPHKIGSTVYKNSKQGGGVYVVIGHINCNRCNEIIEERERTEPTKEQRKKGYYDSYQVWCWNCGLYEGRHRVRVDINELSQQ